MNENLPKMRLLKFDSKTCSACIAMEKRGTVTDIQREYPTLEVIGLTISNADGDVPEGTHYDAAYKLSDDMGVQALPTLIIQDARGVEIERIDGAPSLKDLRKALDTAAEAIRTSEALYAKVEAFKALPR